MADATIDSSGAPLHNFIVHVRGICPSWLSERVTVVSLQDRGAKVAPRTKFEQWIDSLNDEHRQIILGWLTDSWYSNTRIAQMIATDDEEDGFVGYRANKDTIAVWRKANNVAR